MSRKLVLFLSLLLCWGVSNVRAQYCPTNVDVESGSFLNWNCFRGTNSNAGVTYATCTTPQFNFTPTAPVPTLHTIVTGSGTDYYGGFPVVGPGCGAYSIKIGKDTNQYNADGVLYWLHIPAGTTNYQLVYHFAAVLEQPTLHCYNDQPRMTAEAFDSLSGYDLPCDSFCYVGDGSVPGFLSSTVVSTIPGNGADVHYKPWTTGNFKFNGENGKTVGIRFGVGGCTQSGHFGYGYVDMSCGLFAISTLVCGATFITLSAPDGYSGYSWRDSVTGTILGTTQIVTAPPPPGPHTYEVILTPYPGYGCTDTLYTHVIPTNLVLSPSADTAICLGGSATLSTGATDIPAGLPLSYSWAPATGLSCTGCSNPVATPTVTTSYTVTVTNAVGCNQTHVYNITVYPIPAAITGIRTVCSGSTTTLVESVPGGHWSSSNTTIASVGSSTGIVTGGSVGTPTVVTITYSFGTASICGISTTVTVNPLPAAIGGPSIVCSGSSITLTETTPGGTWSSSLSSIASVGSTTGIVVGGSVGAPSVVTISYTLSSTGCVASKTVTVVPLPLPISSPSPAAVCVGATMPLSDPGGGLWSVTNGHASINSTTGSVTGVSAGTDTAIYTLGTGCVSTLAFTVNPAPSPIGGPSSLCQGSTVTETDITSGGFWLSSNISVATIDPFSGLAGGVVIPGSSTYLLDTITYTAAGCSISKVLTVNPLPFSIYVPPAICAGSVDTLIDIGGGTWSVTPPSVATIDPLLGVLYTTSLSGSATVTYTLPTGCSLATPISVLALPSSITGPSTVCVSATILLHDSTSGGAWSASNTNASVDGLGNVTGNSGGTVNISYTPFLSACSAVKTITVNPLPLPISGPLQVCQGLTINMGDATPGGTWSSSNTAVASIGSTGIVTGGVVVGPTTVAITYTSPLGCTRTVVITVYPLPTVIVGTPHVCVGSTTGLSSTPAGGTWSSSVTSVATVGTTGIVSGVGPGTSTVTYTSSLGCPRSVVVTVNSTPGPIQGNVPVCSGATITLSDTTTGGTWTIVPPSTATIGSATGIVTGGVVAVTSTATVTYSLGGTCVATATVTVNPLPGAVTGTPSMCVGGSTSLCSTPPTGTWSSSLTSIATVGTTTGCATAYGVAPGTTLLNYILPTGCQRSIQVTVNPLPKAINGPGTVCAGSTITLTDSTGGGTWSSATPTVASVITGSGVVTGGAVAGTSTDVITYKLSTTGCQTTTTVTVNPLPATFAFSGTSSYCPGDTGRVACLSGSEAGVSYQLFNGGTPVGSTRAGTGSSICWNGLYSGIYTVVATNSTTGCSRTMVGSAVISPAPNPNPIVGPSALCVSATITETDSVAGGTWSPSVNPIATINAAGIVHGVATGVMVITYTTPAGCKATKSLTVSLSPGPITGPNGVCVGACTVISDTVLGGAWSGSSSTIATVTGVSTGLVCGASSGVVTITYSLGSTGCTVYKTMTVTPAPALISGPGAVCVGGTTTLTDATAGGVWSPTSDPIATVSGVGSTGTVYGVSIGSTTITYTVGGCSRYSDVTVNPVPTIITGPNSVCSGQSIPLFDSVSGGLWSCASSAATVNSITGVVTGGFVTVPTAVTITYSLGTGCNKTKVVTVNPIPAAITSSGSFHPCIGSTIVLHDATSGGAWTSGNLSVASVGSSSGVVYPGIPGTDTITYTVPTGCSISSVITVNPLPMPIGGATNICVGGCTYLTDGISGGTWTSTHPTVATAGMYTGLVCGVTADTVTVNYTLPTGCATSVLVTIIAPPAAITGLGSVCAGDTIHLHDVSTGGNWSSVNTDIATVDSTAGIVTGIASGTVIISYSLSSAGAGCSAIKTIIVNPISPIWGDSVVCAGQYLVLTDTTDGGLWTSSNPAVATAYTASPSTGIVTGVSGGTAIITYTLPTGCRRTHMVTVNAAPPPITGVARVCAGSTTTLSETIPGTWGTSNPTVATVVGGIVTGGAITTAALDTITFTSTSFGCAAMKVVTVNPLPPAISGPVQMCLSSSITLSDFIIGGVWSSTPSTIASIDPATGVLTSGTTSGTVFVTYTLPTTCATSTVIAVNPAPDTITGPRVMCIGYTTALSDATSGGTWTSSNAAIAPVDMFSGIVTGLSFGSATITYTAPTTCFTTTTVTVNPIPTGITGTTGLCQGQVSTLSSFPPGGTWSSDNSFVATIDSFVGTMIGVGPGVATVYYTLGSGCRTSTTVVVNPVPDPISGPTAICLGNSTTLFSGPAGGSWTSSAVGVAPVDPAGNVSGSAVGTSLISYVLSTGCAASVQVTVNNAPGPITGIFEVCQGLSTPLSDILPGGTWSSSIPGIATVDPGTGVVLGLSPGISTIIYSTGVGAGCQAIQDVTVNALPSPISGTPVVCRGATTILSDGSPGGSWSTVDPAIATINSSGVVTGVAAGTALISYTAGYGCAATIIVTVNRMPGPIIGSPNMCLGNPRDLSDTAAGGTWSSSNNTVVTIDPVTGVAFGSSLGTATVFYTLGFGCTVSQVETVYQLPTVFTVTGGGSYCNGGAGVLIGMNNSVTGVNYMLYLGGTAYGMVAGTGGPISFGYQTVAGTYIVIATSTSTTCSNLMAGSATVTIIPTVTPAVTINPTPALPVCAGTTTNLSLTYIYSGTGPLFQWRVNGTAVSTANNYSFIPANGDVVTIQMTSNGVCPLPATVFDTLVMGVNPWAHPDVNINATPNDTVCQGTPVTVTALPDYGGTAPAYTWMKNGFSAGSGSSYTFIPSDGDSVRCVMISNYPCGLAPSSVSSPDMVMNVQEPVLPVVAINASPGTSIGRGQFDTLTAVVTNGLPVRSYQWYLNSYPIVNATTNTYVSNTFEINREDSVSCVVTSDELCSVTGHQWVYINASTVHVAQTGLTIGDISVVPNPNKGEFTIKGNLGTAADEEVSFEVTNLIGQIVYKDKVIARNGILNEKVTLGGNNISNGMYMLNLHTDTENKIFHIVVEQ